MISESSKERVQEKIDLEIERFFDRVNKILDEFTDEVTGEHVTPEEYDELDDDIVGLDALSAEEWLRRLKEENDKARPYEPIKPYDEDNTWPPKIWIEQKKAPWEYPYGESIRYEPYTITTPNFSCCERCSNNPKNGGSGFCHCTLPYMTYTAW